MSKLIHADREGETGEVVVDGVAEVSDFDDVK